MKQIIQDLKSGATVLEEVPVPQVKSGCVLIRTTRTLVSLGTERMLVEFGKANLIDKARQQPDKVKQVLDKIKTDGLQPTLEAVFNKLGQPLPLGYCNVGKVVAVGRGVTEFVVGDRVASNGNHAEYVCVPKNLVAKIPDNVTDEEATFTVIGSIGLQGIRLLNPQLGECVVVIGLGLIGLVAAELLKANGCKVIGVDFDQQKVDIAKNKGIYAINPKNGIDPVKYVEEITGGVGADGVLITASAKGDEVIHQACLMSRKRGRVVLVGVIGLNMRRDDFYKKELSFQVSCSYGAGRYDEEYENKGHDYPLAYVRWTEKRNFETILGAISSKILDVQPLITEEVELANYAEIYGDMRKYGSIALILKFSADSTIERVVPVGENRTMVGSGKLGIIGAGNFASATIIPALQKVNAPIKYIASAQGLTAKVLAKKAKAENATSDYRVMLNDPEVNTVIITTRHNLHASMVMETLEAGKSVFVEKPLCLNEEELQNIENAYMKANDNITLTVGFNRRFSPFAVKMKALVGGGPKNIVATMNAGYIPPEVWVQDMEVGGGRIIGEACHFIDLCSFLADSKVIAVCMNALGENPQENTDNVSILLKYENGTNAVINYFANGSKSYAKERIEVFSQEKVLVLDNWRRLEGFGVKGFSKMTGTMDKGHKRQFALLNERVQKGGEALIPFESIVNTTRASFACIESLKKKAWVEIR
ncbi:MAG: bi-domain-containing oxidoreductase [Butyricimonas virosa]|uniref:bi-domain-containing oxidoreductase n=1 Tax=Butyricimonas virosa TaxID=544645 RepID=UPI00242CABFA|nr:bi-domain-containing oxidoreductase [Butyricimonas virosa]MCI7164315.1 bi-domain-containing oxidoreductase [Butyricimonas virosa]MDY5014256.1 bi-domain-containing oxidoreductase [Butyricimonas virosa]